MAPFLVRVRVALLMGIVLALSTQFILIQHAYHSLITPEQLQLQLPSTTSSSKETTEYLSRNSLSKGYDCSIYWLRLPKTASTSIFQLFWEPMAGMFNNTETGPNACILGVGGCAPFWNGSSFEKMPDQNHGAKISTVLPPYGIATENDATNTLSHTESYSGRCFPLDEGPKIDCYEYDARTSTINFGPHRYNPKRRPLPTWKRIEQYASSSPNLKTHVGLDPSLFGLVLPKKPMVFSTFRDPVERLLSSFHYGMKFGGGRPGEVGKCDLPGHKRQAQWQESVVRARTVATTQNDTSDYQKLLRDYLHDCRMAADNAYVQFLDPNTKDIHVAMANLERYVIVGLQSDLQRTLDRWKNITLQSCGDHPQFEALKKALFMPSTSTSKTDTHYRKSVSRVDGSGKAGKFGRVDAVNLVSPDIDMFDEDLKELLRKMTAGDEYIYKRVIEMHDELLKQ